MCVRASVSLPVCTEVRASHVLVKHKDVRRPVDRNGNPVTRTKEEAVELLLGYKSDVVEGRATFEDIALQHSDCSSGSRGGDLGFFAPGAMQKPFEEAS